MMTNETLTTLASFVSTHWAFFFGAVLACIYYLAVSIRSALKAPSPRLEKILTAYNTANGFYEFIWHIGYQHIELPRTLRRALAGTDFHRAWIGGYHFQPPANIRDNLHLDELDEYGALSEFRNDVTNQGDNHV